MGSINVLHIFFIGASGVEHTYHKYYSTPEIRAKHMRRIKELHRKKKPCRYKLTMTTSTLYLEE